VTFAEWVKLKSKYIGKSLLRFFDFKSISFLLAFSLVLFISPTNLFAAEVLQVRGPTVLQIGDRNRSYTVKLACIEIDPMKEKSSIDLLKGVLKNRKKVNLKPRGSVDGALLSRVISIEDNLDISQLLSDNGLGILTC